MRRGKTIKFGWQKFLNSDYLSKPPEGYSSAKEICEKLGYSKAHVNANLKVLHEQGKVDRVKVKLGGKIIYYYKD